VGKEEEVGAAEAMTMNFYSLHETILASMGEAVYVIDRNLRIQYTNPAAEKLTGYSWDEAVGMDCHEVFCEQSHRCEDLCPPKKAMNEAAPILHRDAETRTKSGDVRQTQISISPFFDGAVCIGAVIVIKDISELKKAEEKIRSQNKFLTAVIDALPHPFYVIDAETYRLKLANYAAYQGDRPEHLTCHQLSHDSSTPCSGAGHPCPLEKVKETGLPVTVEHAHRGADGGNRDVEVHGFPIFDDKGKITQVIEYSIDISDRKQAEADREKLILDLRQALHEVKTLSGLLPICASCKKIRDDKGYWNNLERYISERSDAEFSHGICPDCAQRLYPEYYKKQRT
jgi:PAS domain S-box-containing protein